MSTLQLIPATSTTDRAFQKLVERTFIDTPLWKSIFPNDKKRHQIFPYLSSCRARLMLPKSFVLVDGDKPIGHVALATPDQSAMAVSLWDVIVSGYALVPFFIESQSFKWLSQLNDHWKELGSKQGKVWTLEAVCIDSTVRGNGLGTLMMNKVLEMIPKGDVVYLTTQEDANVRFYKKFGFVVIEEESLVYGTEITNYVMTRQC
ncbi:hypothetical protein HK103_000033 [Boothiomyces macroporosus]|uniref:N-acetyltransferase domain-containing protein n=1 Tax=Boothiomyces macroporosus TaxID=261099 RepID=A0AAD5UMS5_9FUNG|nr:hypothetical protein HK103_000033 [Boothiomyces macroporosus]